MQLLDQERTRVPDLVPLRHERMLASPFAFYRGAAIVMASDLGANEHSGLQVQACGDAHLSNFGGFATPERSLAFSINDFDETNPGPFEWDVKRLAASLEIAGRAREFDDATNRAIVGASVRSYRKTMIEFSTLGNLDLWYLQLDVDTALSRWRKKVSTAEVARLQRVIAKAKTKDNMKAFNRLTHVVDGKLRIVSDPPLVSPIDALFPGATIDDFRDWLVAQFRNYRSSLAPDRRVLLESYELVDFARKVVGVGSVGTRCFIALLTGKDQADPLFLQIKEAEASVLEPYTTRSQYGNHGQRVVEGQRLLQASGDIMLGWTRATGLDGVDRDFYFRQLWDWKLSADIETMSPAILKVYGEMCGWSLARAHARSGDRIALAAYLGTSSTFDNAIADFAGAYADQNQRDYEAALATSQGGSLTVEPLAAPTTA